jgi:hypothetical protein
MKDRIHLSGCPSHVPKGEGHGAPSFSSFHWMGTWATRHLDIHWRLSHLRQHPSSSYLCCKWRSRW